MPVVGPKSLALREATLYKAGGAKGKKSVMAKASKAYAKKSKKSVAMKKK